MHNSDCNHWELALLKSGYEDFQIFLLNTSKTEAGHKLLLTIPSRVCSRNNYIPILSLAFKKDEHTCELQQVLFFFFFFLFLSNGQCIQQIMAESGLKRVKLKTVSTVSVEHFAAAWFCRVA